MSSSKITLTLAAFAHDLGAAERITRDVSVVWHKQYVGADSVTRTALREEFILNFLIGYGLTATKAAKVLALSREQRSHEEQKVYDAARAKFTYHIVRPEKGNGAADADPVDTLLAKFAKLTAAQQRKFLKAVSQQ